MKKKLLLLVIVLSSACYSNHSGAEALTNKHWKPIEEAQLFQDKLQQLINEVQPATVLITTRGTRGGSGGMTGSGVCVSADGIIITAGHMVISGAKYVITYPDNTKASAIGLGKIGTLDLGMLKITEEGDYPFAEMGYSSSLEVGDYCFSLAYPGSFNAKMAVRLGKVGSLRDGKYGYLKTTCLMEPGDSGGPVFDMNGKVIGIRSYIGMSLDENYDAPIDFYREYWTALQEAEEYRFYPDKDSVVYPKDSVEFISFDENDFKKNMSNVVDFVSTISSTRGELEKSIQGLLINLDGATKQKEITRNSYVLSKSSEVYDDFTVKVDDQVFEDATILYRDYDKDLVLIRLNSKLESALDIQNIVDKDIQESDVGKILYSPIDGGQDLISVLGSADFNHFGRYSSGYLGTRVELKDGKSIVTTVQPNSSAVESSLTVGDELIRINDIEIDKPSTLVAELNKTKPYEVVKLVRAKDDIEDTLQIELKARPFRGFNHISERFEDGRSDRRDGFEKIFIHDARLKPSECGGPIVDVDGRVVGVNIARMSRTSSLGLSGKEINDFLKSYLNSEDIKK